MKSSFLNFVTNSGLQIEVINDSQLQIEVINDSFQKPTFIKPVLLKTAWL